MVRLLFRNNLLPLDTEPYSIIMQVGSIEAAKDTREIIEGTIGVHQDCKAQAYATKRH